MLSEKLWHAVNEMWIPGRAIHSLSVLGLQGLGPEGIDAGCERQHTHNTVIGVQESALLPLVPDKPKQVPFQAQVIVRRHTDYNYQQHIVCVFRNC